MPEEAKKKPEIDPARAVSGNFPSNSKTKKVEAEPEAKEIVPFEGMVVKQQKPSMARRMRDAFTGEDSTSIGEYLLLQVAIPTIKNLIYDLITGGANRALFGSGVKPVQGANPNNRTGNVNYSAISRAQVNGTAAPSMSTQDKANHNFGNLVFATRMEAEQVLQGMIGLIERYDVVAISDLYNMVNVTGSFADDKYGWFELHGASIDPARGGGFVLDLPAPRPIR